MNQDDIIRMAREAGYGQAMADLHGPALERFAKLVAAAEREACMQDQKSLVEFNSLLAKHHTALVEQQKPGPWPAKEVIDKAVAAEREACAKVCESRYMGDNNREDMEAKRCAAAIRARGKVETKTPDYLEKCPNCGGPADNGFDRSWPDPNPYYCTKCMEAEEY